MSHMAKYKTAIVNPNPKLLEIALSMVLKEFQTQGHWAYESYISRTKYQLVQTPQGTMVEIICDEMNATEVTQLFNQIYQALATELSLTTIGYNVTTVKDKEGCYIVQGVMA